MAHRAELDGDMFNLWTLNGQVSKCEGISRDHCAICPMRDNNCDLYPQDASALIAAAGLIGLGLICLIVAVYLVVR